MVLSRMARFKRGGAGSCALADSSQRDCAAAFVVRLFAFDSKGVLDFPCWCIGVGIGEAIHLAFHGVSVQDELYKVIAWKAGVLVEVFEMISKSASTTLRPDGSVTVPVIVARSV